MTALDRLCAKGCGAYVHPDNIGFHVCSETGGQKAAEVSQPRGAAAPEPGFSSSKEQLARAWADDTCLVGSDSWRVAYESYLAALRTTVETAAPLPMLLFCPDCWKQHIDEPHGDWKNPPHKSHQCQNCGCIWRPSDVPTTGVREITTVGKADTWSMTIRGALKTTKAQTDGEPV